MRLCLLKAAIKYCALLFPPFQERSIVQNWPYSLNCSLSEISDCGSFGSAADCVNPHQIHCLMAHDCTHNTWRGGITAEHCRALPVRVALLCDISRTSSEGDFALRLQLPAGLAMGMADEDDLISRCTYLSKACRSNCELNLSRWPKYVLLYTYLIFLPFYLNFVLMVLLLTSKL